MNSLGIVFPHQLFEQNPLFDKTDHFVLVEEGLFFNQYNFHKQKLLFHRASMKFYADYLLSRKNKVLYIESHEAESDIRKLLPFLRKRGVDHIHYVDVTDNWLQQRIVLAARQLDIKFEIHTSPLFMNSYKDSVSFFSGKRRFRQTEFYILQRKRWNILLSEEKKPLGGKWTYDSDNRVKYPKDKQAPLLPVVKPGKYHEEAHRYVQKHFSSNYGSIEKNLYYPDTFEATKKWLEAFFHDRFFDYGTYQDAMVHGESFLHHSVISPMLNVGLIAPGEIIDSAIAFAKQNNVPVNSLEGFIRQILGWREFLRGIYEVKGSEERTTNFWGFTRKIPKSFWDASTGIYPIDETIKGILKTGYAHHIERLMILGNFMLLCEFDPDEVYRWFMEMFVDAYDWVMVPNVYGMSQFADGGLMATKPYISGSNYILKMSNYAKGEWVHIWDGLFWRFIDKQRHVLGKNPRLKMLIKTYDKMDSEKREKHVLNADTYINGLELKFDSE